MKLKYNECFDFLTAVHRFARRKEIREHQEEMRMAGIPELAEWADNLESILPPLFRNDLDFFVKRNPVCDWIVRAAGRDQVICETPEELLTRLDGLTGEQFTGYARQALNITVQEPLNEKQIEDLLLNSTTDAYPNSQETAKLVLSLLASPEDFLPRIRGLYREFYRLAWLPFRDRFISAARPLLAYHSGLLEKDAKGYLNAVTGGIIGDLWGDITEMTLLFAYTGDTEVYITTENPMILIGAGTGERIRQKTASENTDLLFGLLGDKKRLEILRLLCCRSWYSNQLAEHFSLTPATMSYHLNKLLSAGLISVQPGEQNRFYYVMNRNTLDELINSVRQDLNLDRDICSPEADGKP